MISAKRCSDHGSWSTEPGHQTSTTGYPGRTTSAPGKTFIGKIYRGDEGTATGSFIGLGWGLADGFVGGAIVAWVYNLFVGGQVAKQDA